MPYKIRLSNLANLKARTYIKIFFSLVSVFSASCNTVESSGDSGLAKKHMDTGETPKMESSSSAYFKPAFKGQTKATYTKSQTGISVTKVVKSDRLYKPWSIKFIKNTTNMLIAQKNGYFRIVSMSGEISDSIKIPNVCFDDSVGGSNAGLFDVVLDPNFSTNATIYFSYSKGSQEASELVVAKAKASLDFNSPAISDIQDIYTVKPTIADLYAYGGRLMFDRSGYLFITTGARFSHTSEFQAQNLNSGLGKILRIKRDGKPAPNNPFEKIRGALPEIWALGIRSPLGLAFHPATGQLWEAEHGPYGGDEVNIIKPGANYGWPLISYGANYNGTPVGTGIVALPNTNPQQYKYDERHKPERMTQSPGLVQPIYYWNPCIAPGGMTFYTSSAIKEWKNNLFITALRGYLIRLIIDPNGQKIVGEERLLTEVNQRLRDVTVGPDGALYVITDTPEGVVYRVGK